MLGFPRPKAKEGSEGDKKAIDPITCFGGVSEPWQQGFRSRETPAGLSGF